MKKVFLSWILVIFITCSSICAYASETGGEQETITGDVQDGENAEPVENTAADDSIIVSQEQPEEETDETAQESSEISDSAESEEKQDNELELLPAEQNNELELQPAEQDSASESLPAEQGSESGISDEEEEAEVETQPQKIPISSLTLAYPSLLYNGSPRTQTKTLTVTAAADGAVTTLKSGQDYSVQYRNNTNVGTATVTVTGTGDYIGTLTGTFRISPAKIKSVKLKHAALIYTGKKRTQTVDLTVRAILKGAWVTLGRSSYNVSYKNNINVGTATVSVTGKGNYTGTIDKTFSIIPKKAKLKSLKLIPNKIKVTWEKHTAQTSGFQVQYSTNKNFPSSNRKTKTVKSAKSVSTTLTGLTAGKTYYVRIRAYKTVDGKNYYSGWSASKSLKYAFNVLTVSGSGTARTVTIKNPYSTASGLKAAVWSNANGQDDLHWYKMTKKSDGNWSVKVSAARIADTGKCPVHVYTGGNVFLNGTSLSFTAKELEEAGGKSLIHKYAKAVLAESGNDLRGAYDWAIRNIPYQSMVVPMTLPKTGPYSVFTRQELYFIYAFENRQGNCFCLAAAVYWCAKELGYSVRLIEGKVLLPSGAYGPHSWVELDTGDGTVILDPESEQELEQDGYWKTYETGPSLAYRPDLPAY